MRRLLSSITQLALLVAVPLVVGLASPAIATAASVDVLPACDAGGVAANTDVCQSVAKPGQPGNNPIIRILRVTIQILSIIIGFVAVIMIIIAGLSFVTANGDSNAIAKARSSIVYALVGLIVAGMAQVLVAFVINKL